MLLLERGHHRHHRFDKARPCGTLGPKAAFAPEDPRANRPLGGIVRGLHAFDPHERPQGVVDLSSSRQVPSVLGTPQVWPASSSRATARRSGRIRTRKWAWVQRAIADRCHHETSAGPAPAGLPQSPGSGPHARSWLQSRAADAPSRPAATASDTRCRRSSDPSPTCPRTAPPRAPGPPWPHATGGPQRR